MPLAPAKPGRPVRASLSFTNVTAATGTGSPETAGGHGVQWADVDGDGRPDIYVTMIVSGSSYFQDMTPGSGIPPERAWRTRGVAAFDMDSDGDVDILTADPGGVMTILASYGAGGFTLVDPASLGLASTVDNAVSLADVNNDGHLDMLLDRVLYVNDGDNTYTSRGTVGGGGYMGGFGAAAARPGRATRARWPSETWTGTATGISSSPTSGSSTISSATT